MPPTVYANFCEMLDGKTPQMQLFDRITAPKINTYLRSLMSQLSAKVCVCVWVCVCVGGGVLVC